jgi:hypothetical protein
MYHNLLPPFLPRLSIGMEITITNYIRQQEVSFSKWNPSDISELLQLLKFLTATQRGGHLLG